VIRNEMIVIFAVTNWFTFTSYEMLSTWALVKHAFT